MTSTVLKAQIDSQITNETTPNGITPTDVGTNLKSIVDYVDQQLPYKSYHAILSQTGTSATITLLSNNLPTAVTFAVAGTGNYTFTSTGSFTVGKTVLFKGVVQSGLGKANMQFNTSSNGDGINRVSIYAYDDAGALSDAVFVNMPIEIRVYN